MEGLAIISLVSMFGYFLSNKKENTEYTENIRNITDTDMYTMPELEKPVSLNIYNSKMASAADNETMRLSMLNYKDSENPSLTGILPPIYNSYSAQGDDSLFGPNTTTNLSWKDLAQIDDVNRRKDINSPAQPTITERPMFNSFASIQTVGQTDTNFSAFDAQQPATNKEISLLTGLPIEREHSNQVAFFGANVTQNVESYTNTSVLDSYTGMTSNFFHKKEPVERFAQVPEYNINGTTRTPLVTDHIDTSRFIPSVFKQGEKPFYPDQVPAPIAFTEYNPVTKAQLSQPTIDDLRVSNKAQISYEGRINPASEPVPARGNLGKTAKNKVDSSFELGHSRLFTGPGAVIGNKSNENYNNLQPTSRKDQNLEYYGIPISRTELKSGPKIHINAGSLDNSNEINWTDSQAQKAKRTQLANDTSRNISTILSPNVHDYGRSSTYAVEMQRETTSKFNVVNINKENSATQMYYLDDAKTTNKETSVGLTDTHLNLKSDVNGNTNTGLTSWDPKTTHKESTLNEDHHQHANKKDQMGYNIANYDAKITNKQTSMYNDYIGASNYYTGKPENRDQYSNADISDKKEQLLVGEHPSGTNSSFGKVAAGEGLVGIIKSNDNMLLKEKYNTHTQNLNNISNNIPSKTLIGAPTQQEFHHEQTQLDVFSNKNPSNSFNRFNGDTINTQLKNNPYYNIKRTF